MGELRAKLLRPGGAELVEGDQVYQAPPEGSVLWVDGTELDEEVLARLAEAHGFHSLAAADILSEEGRARVERFGDHLLLVVKALNFNPEQDPLDVINLYVFLFPDRILTFRSEPVRSLDEAWKDAAELAEDGGTGLVLHAVLSRLFQRYLEATDEVEDELESLQPGVEGGLDQDLPGRLFQWRRSLNRFRKRTRPHREAILELVSLKHPALPAGTRPYLRDALDMVLRIDDRIQAHRDLIQGAGEMYMAGAAQETNEVMKLLSLVATVVLPLNILTGLYGTNFEVVPGSKAEHGFWIFLVAMVVVAGATAAYLRRRGWL